MPEDTVAFVQALKQELEGVAVVRDGDSNDDHIAALEGALSVALDFIEYLFEDELPLLDIDEFRMGALA